MTTRGLARKIHRYCQEFRTGMVKDKDREEVDWIERSIYRWVANSRQQTHKTNSPRPRISHLK